MKSALSNRSTNATALADKIGVCLSLSCAIHCAAAPLVIAAMAATGFELAVGDFWHSIFILSTCMIAAANFSCSYRLHRRTGIWPLFFLAVAALVAGHFVHEGPHETALTAFGGLILAGCHLLNRRYCSECCSTLHKKSCEILG